MNVSASLTLSVVLQPQKKQHVEERAKFIENFREAVYCGFLASYAQGMNLIARASYDEKWGVRLGDCIQI